MKSELGPMNNEDVIELRRDLHRNAELGFVEFYTASRVSELLENLPVKLRTGAAAMRVEGIVDYPDAHEREVWAGHAITAGADAARVNYFRDNGTAMIAEIQGSTPGPMWGLRVDMDALPIREASDEGHLPFREGFNSVTDAMHACGHDGHTAIGVALLDRLSDKDFPGTLRVLFQPAEESVRGAQAMLDAGATEGIERMLAVHLGHDRATGVVAGSSVHAMATSKYVVDFRGVAAHAAAAPERGRNALAAAATATLGLLGITRVSTGSTRINVGTLRADGAANIIPAIASMTFETRGTTNESFEEIDRRANEVVRGAAAMYGVEIDMRVSGRAPTMVPDESMIDFIERAASAVGTVTQFVRTLPAGGSDDANLFIRAVQSTGGQGAYIQVSSGNLAPHHSEYFDVEESSIFIALDLLEEIVRNGNARL